MLTLPRAAPPALCRAASMNVLGRDRDAIAGNRASSAWKLLMVKAFLARPGQNSG
ncbi:hypothetical protein HMPREF9946_03533 [Acetobacteraceae bacterium AT-5844]|nr:hypothetical protein HMPREF9946_03533 [Acetobacteraceae bacterium AT-5844]